MSQFDGITKYIPQLESGELFATIIREETRPGVISLPGIARDREEILLILGNGCSSRTGKSDYTSFDYRGYLYCYETGKFARIN